MNKYLVIIVSFFLTNAAHASLRPTVCGADAQTYEELRSIVRNRGLVMFDGQPRYGVFTFGPGSVSGYACQGNSPITLMFRYQPEHHRVVFFECRNGYVYWNVDGKGGAACR